MTEFSLAELIALFAFDDDGVARGTEATLDYGIAGALLTELYLASRIDVIGGLVAVLDSSTTGHSLIDAALRRVDHDRRDHDAKRWILRLSKDARGAVIDRLVDNGHLRRQRDSVLLFLRRTRYLTPGGLPSPIVHQVRRHIRAATIDSSRADTPTKALCALLSALGWNWQALPGVPHDSAERLLSPYRRDLWVANTLKIVVDDARLANSGASRV